MSVEAMSAVFNHSAATGTAKVVLLGIANHEGDGGSWPSIERLMRYAQADRRTVQRAIEKLIEIGELRRIMQQGGTHKTPAGSRPNLYRVLVVCPPTCDRTSAHNELSTGAAPTPPLDGVRGGAHAAPGAAPTPPEPSTNHPLPTAPEVPHVGNRASGHKHLFDEVSGYCQCGYRSDGRLVDPKSGLQFQPPASERGAS